MLACKCTIRNSIMYNLQYCHYKTHTKLGESRATVKTLNSSVTTIHSNIPYTTNIQKSSERLLEWKNLLSRCSGRARTQLYKLCNQCRLHDGMLNFS